MPSSQEELEIPIPKIPQQEKPGQEVVVDYPQTDP
jgi:hypothetical protein